MANSYYTFSPSFIPGTKVRSDAMNNQLGAIENAFDLLPGDPDALITATATFAPESGSGNAYVVTMPTTRTSNTDGDQVVFFATHTNTAAATLNVDGLGAVAIVRADGAVLVASDIISGLAYVVRYDATNTRFQLMTPNNSFLVDATAQAAASAASASAASASASTASAQAVIAGQWATHPEDDDIDSAPGQFSAFHWAQKALGAASTNRILTDITTATPPTTEAVSGELQIYDADETDQLARYGFVGSNQLVIGNLMHGGKVLIAAEDSSGTPQTLLSGDPDGAFEMHHIGDRSMLSQATGIVVQGDSVSSISSGLQNTNIALHNRNGVEIGSLGFATAGGRDVNIRNDLWSGAVILQGTSSGGVSQNFATFSSENQGVHLYQSGIDIARTNNNDGEALEIKNSKSGNGAYQRVLTTFDRSALDFAWDFDTSTAAADPGVEEFRFDNATLASVTNIYVSDTSEDIAGGDAGGVISQLIVGDIILMRTGINDLMSARFQVSGAPTDNTGWWTIPVTVISSGTIPTANYTTFFSFILQGGSSIADGTADGQMLVWDQTIDQAWEPTVNLNWNDTTSTMSWFSSAGATLSGRIRSNSGPERLTFMDPADAIALSIYSSGIVTSNLLRVQNGFFELSNAAGNSRIKFDSDATAGVTAIAPTAGAITRLELQSLDLGLQGTAKPTAVVTGTALLWCNPDGNSATVYNTGEFLTAPLDNVFVGSWRFNTPTTAADPTATLFRLNSGTPASVTAIYIDDTDAVNEDGHWFLSSIAIGDVLSLRTTASRNKYIVGTVNSVTDNTSWWTIGITLIESGSTIFTNVDHVQFELQKTSAAGNITKVGTPVDNQVAVWTGDGTLEGDANFTWDGSLLTVTHASNPAMNFAGPTARIRQSGSNFISATAATVNIGPAGTASVGITSSGMELFGTNPNFFINDAGQISFEDDVGSANPLILSNPSSVAADATLRIASVAATPIVEFYDGMRTRWFDSANTDTMTMNVIGNFGVQDGSGIDGFKLELPNYYLERAAAGVDATGYGQVWVRNYAANQLWFTDDTGADFPVATAIANIRTNTASDMTTDTIARDLINGVCFFDNGTAYTITLEPSSDTQFPVGSSFQVVDAGTGVITINEGTGDTLWFIENSGTVTDTAGGCTITGGVATVYRSAAATWYIWGSNITA